MAVNVLRQPKGGTGFALSLLSSVFFTWGFLTALNNVLIPHLQQVFQLTYAQSMMIQGIFFSGPLLISLPTARLMKVIGYNNTLLAGLSLIVAGSLMFYPATAAFSISMVLFAVLILALGVAALQVVANPFVAQLGELHSAPSRLTMASGINSLGTTVAPYIGAVILLSDTAENVQQKAELVQLPYLLIALSVIGLMFLIKRAKISEPAPLQQNKASITVPVWKHRHLMLGLLALFCYTGAEVSIGSFLLNYLSDANLGGFEREAAGKMISLYWGGAMVGRLSGSFLFRYINARKVLVFNTILAVACILFAVINPGRTGAMALIAVGLCNSIMYPVIFSLAQDKLGSAASQASGLLVMTGIGGAILPFTQALVADSHGLILSLLIPVGCYVIILGYGLYGWKPMLFNREMNLQASTN